MQKTTTSSNGGMSAANKAPQWDGPVQGVVAGQAQQESHALPPVQGIPLYDTSLITNNTVRVNLNKFVKQGYQDCWAAGLFVLTLILTIVLGCLNFGDNVKYIEQELVNRTDSQSLGSASEAMYSVPSFNSPTVRWSIIILMGVTLLAAFGGYLALALFSAHPKQAIIACNVAVAVLYAVLGVFSLMAGAIGAAIFSFIFAALALLWLYLVRDRIPFAAAILRVSCHVVNRYKAAIISGFLAVLVFYVYAVFWTSMMLPVNRRVLEEQRDNGQPKGGDAVLSILYILLFFWAAQVIINVCHVTVCGLVATWYFCGDGNMPPNPTWSSFKRAMTTSFGSICFGSLLVAIIKTLRYLAESNRRNDNSFIRCVALCLLSCLEAILQYFNTYAFVHIAIYGCGYVEASRRTWALAKDHFWRGAFNDCLIGPTISWTSFGIGCLLGLIAWIAFGAGIGLVALVIGVAVTLIMLRCVESAVPTIFVCYCECPDALMNSAVELYNLLHNTDTGVVTSPA